MWVTELGTRSRDPLVCDVVIGMMVTDMVQTAQSVHRDRQAGWDLLAAPFLRSVGLPEGAAGRLPPERPAWLHTPLTDFFSCRRAAWAA